MKTMPMFLLILLLLSACGQSGQTAQPEQTATPTFALPVIVVYTKTPVPVFTPSITPTPTLMRVASPLPEIKLIKADPQDLLLAINDLPLAGKYYLPNAGLSRLSNREIIQSLGAEKAQEYINETGRVDGWTVNYKRGSNTVSSPEEVVDSVVVYETVEGAQSSIEKYWNLNRSPDFRQILGYPTVGDLSLAISLTKGNRVQYVYYFSYSNYVHTLELKGIESGVTLDLVKQLADKLLARLVSVQFEE
jgi:hypothetical protein